MKSIHKIQVFASIFLLAFGIVGCAGKPVSFGKITKGHLAEAHQFPAVALLKKDFSGKFYVYCSGVLVGDDTLLTAAHCTVNEQDKLLSVADVRVVVGEVFPSRPGVDMISVRQLHLHPDYRQELMQKDDRGLVVPGAAHDLALWKLTQKVEAGLPVEVASSESLTLDSLPLLIGYGSQSAWNAPGAEATLNYAETQYANTFTVSQMEKVLVNGRWVTKKVEYEIDSTTDHEFFLGGPGLPDTCGGDSGGPVLIKERGQLLLIGITSRGISTCDRGGIYTFVPAYLAWMQKVIASTANSESSF